MKPFSPVTLLTLRGALAAGIAITITTFLSLERPYWVIMIAVVLVNQTTGQSLRRSGERMLATLAGLTVGWALEWLTASHRLAETGILMAAVFFAVFFRQSWGRGSYLWMTFFISLYVVFLFAMLGEWTPKLFLFRVADTGLGAGAALLATFAVPSPGSRARLHKEAAELWKSCRTELVDALDRFGTAGALDRQPHTAFLLQLDTLRSRAEEALYETFLRPQARRTALDNLARVEMLCYLSLGLFDALICAGQSSRRRAVADILRRVIEPVTKAELEDFLIPPRATNACPPTPTQPRACRLAVEECERAGIEPADQLWAMPAIYYAAALREMLAVDARHNNIPPDA